MAEVSRISSREIGPQNIFPGDVYIYQRILEGHSGISMTSRWWTPVFRRDRAYRVLFACNRSGGRYRRGPPGLRARTRAKSTRRGSHPTRIARRAAGWTRLLLTIVRANVRTPSGDRGRQLFGSRPATTPARGGFRPMLDEFRPDDIDGLSDYIVETSRAGDAGATRACRRVFRQRKMIVRRIRPAGEPACPASKSMVTKLSADFAGTSGMKRASCERARV